MIGGIIIFLLCYINVLLVELLIIFVPNFHLAIPLMTMTQEVLPPIHLLFLNLKITLVKRLFQARAANLWNSSVDVDTRTNYISLSLSEFKSRALSNPLIIDFSIVYNFHGSIFFKVLYDGTV